MIEKSSPELSRFEELPYEYFFDGRVRRNLHLYGEKQINFYGRTFRQMHFDPSQVVLDVGAGMGQDSAYIAERYRPRTIFMLEPHRGDPIDFDDKFLLLGTDLEKTGLEHLVLLPSPASRDHSAVIPKGIPEEDLSYLQPLLGVAEQIPVPDQSIDRLLSVHSAYEFTDRSQALKEFERVMKPKAVGVLITNGTGDKLTFKKILAEVGSIIGSEATTVSSSLDYQTALAEVSSFFPHTKLQIYRDDMIVNNTEVYGKTTRLDYYMYALNSYRRHFKPLVTDTGLFRRAVGEAVERIVDSQLKSKGELRDTIDIGAIFFSKDPETFRRLGKNALDIFSLKSMARR
jgi:ubiquinone/menaquinone biosynthesis C-methylase UbiE